VIRRNGQPFDRIRAGQAARFYQARKAIQFASTEDWLDQLALALAATG
jgi:hypothetical protein